MGRLLDEFNALQATEPSTTGTGQTPQGSDSVRGGPDLQPGSSLLAQFDQLVVEQPTPQSDLTPVQSQLSGSDEEPEIHGQPTIRQTKPGGFRRGRITSGGGNGTFVPPEFEVAPLEGKALRAALEQQQAERNMLGIPAEEFLQFAQENPEAAHLVAGEVDLESLNPALAAAQNRGADLVITKDGQVHSSNAFRTRSKVERVRKTQDSITPVEAGYTYLSADDPILIEGRGVWEGLINDIGRENAQMVARVAVPSLAFALGGPFLAGAAGSLVEASVQLADYYHGQPNIPRYLANEYGVDQKTIGETFQALPIITEGVINVIPGARGSDAAATAIRNFMLNEGREILTQLGAIQLTDFARTGEVRVLTPTAYGIALAGGAVSGTLSRANQQRQTARQLGAEQRRLGERQLVNRLLQHQDDAVIPPSGATPVSRPTTATEVVEAITAPPTRPPEAESTINQAVKDVTEGNHLSPAVVEVVRQDMTTQVERLAARRKLAPAEQRLTQTVAQMLREDTITPEGMVNAVIERGGNLISVVDALETTMSQAGRDLNKMSQVMRSIRRLAGEEVANAIVSARGAANPYGDGMANFIDWVMNGGAILKGNKAAEFLIPHWPGLRTIDDIRRGLLVSQIVTTTRNFWTNQINYQMSTVEDAIADTFAQAMPGVQKYFRANERPMGTGREKMSLQLSALTQGRVGAVRKTPQPTEARTITMLDGAKKQIDAVPDRELDAQAFWEKIGGQGQVPKDVAETAFPKYTAMDDVEQILFQMNDNPHVMRLFEDRGLGELVGSTELVDLLNTFNRGVDKMFRHRVFEAHLRAYAKNNRIQWADVVAAPNKLIPDNVLNDAVTDSLRVSFAEGARSDIIKKTINELYHGDHAFAPLTRMALTTVQPFPRFQASAFNWLMDHLPTTPIKLGGAATGRGAYEAVVAGANLQNPVTAFVRGAKQSLKQNIAPGAHGQGVFMTRGVSTDELAKEVSGMMLFASVVGLKEYFGNDGDLKWYQLRIPGMGVTDLRALSPVPQMAFMYDAIKELGERALGLNEPGDIPRIGATDYMEGILFMNRLAGPITIFSDVLSGRVEGGAVGEAGRRAMGQYLAGFGVPLLQLRDAMALIKSTSATLDGAESVADPESIALRETDTDSTLGQVLNPVLRGVPGANQILPSAVDVRQLDPITPHAPLTRVVSGATFRPDVDLRAAWEEAGLTTRETQPNTGIPELDIEVSKLMRQWLDLNGNAIVNHPLYGLQSQEAKRILWTGYSRGGVRQNGILGDLEAHAKEVVLNFFPEIEVALQHKRTTPSIRGRLESAGGLDEVHFAEESLNIPVGPETREQLRQTSGQLDRTQPVTTRQTIPQLTQRLREFQSRGRTLEHLWARKRDQFELSNKDLLDLLGAKEALP